MLRFSNIGRPAVYRFTILVSALVVAAALWGHNTLYALSDLLQRQEGLFLSMTVLVEVIATVLAAMILAEVYRRLATSPDDKHRLNHHPPADAPSPRALV